MPLKDRRRKEVSTKVYSEGHLIDLTTITPIDVKEINSYFGADASSFGPLGAYGVMEIITFWKI